eukprot:CAMPEP_0182467522 /NCGR_PEP_ID=MMETSP1319-20130603/14064_1 /TAXON_ID=172717 /ORGANISM="Bolidomonas pacifica, Strain RCC208" /LENGTH=380 /DNA_ID=CAMNT_0024667609 /DNA_START=105 /DNA_END=1243 /DNA_ORIENTATION=+
MDDVDEGVIELGSDGAFDLSALEVDAGAGDAPRVGGKQGLSSHLDDVRPPPALEPWLEAKEAGNSAYSGGKLELAMKEYTRALSLGEGDASGLERAKIKSNRGLAGMKLGLGGSEALVPSSFNVRDLSMNKWLCEKNEKRAELLKMAADDCESALFDLQGVSTAGGGGGGGKVVETQIIKTMHRRAQALSLLGLWSEAMSLCSQAHSRLPPSVPMSLKQGVTGMLRSLQQVEKDAGAVKEGLNCVAKLVMDGKGGDGGGVGCSRAAVSGSLACAQAGGSPSAIIGLAAATAYNIGATDTDDPRKALSEICEAVAKSAHYHKQGPKEAATAVFDAFERRTVWPTVKLARCGSMAQGLSREALRGAGAAAAMVASLRTENRG